MKKLWKLNLIIFMSFILVACQSDQLEFEYTALDGVERIDQTISIPSDTEFLKMDDSVKKTHYEALDKIGVDAQSQYKASDYSNIEELDSEKAYIKFLESNQEEAKIMYIGFDECPWCKAFSPKINQIASEFDLPIYYYNTRSRSEDLTYMQIMENFQVETVPYVFIMVEGEPMERINHLSSMQQIEDFFSLFNEKYR
ncbi:hypothetical protein ACF3NG_03695 [Aerococcaceae bacterium WGS1372]